MFDIHSAVKKWDLERQGTCLLLTVHKCRDRSLKPGSSGSSFRVLSTTPKLLLRISGLKKRSLYQLRLDLNGLNTKEVYFSLTWKSGGLHPRAGMTVLLHKILRNLGFFPQVASPSLGHGPPSHDSIWWHLHSRQQDRRSKEGNGAHQWCLQVGSMDCHTTPAPTSLWIEPSWATPSCKDVWEISSLFWKVILPAEISVTVEEKENSCWGINSNVCHNLKGRNPERKQLENCWQKN